MRKLKSYSPQVRGWPMYQNKEIVGEDLRIFKKQPNNSQEMPIENWFFSALKVCGWNLDVNFSSSCVNGSTIADSEQVSFKKNLNLDIAE